MSGFVRRCVLAHVKRRALLVFGIVLPIALLFALVGMIADELPAREVLLVALCGCSVGFLVLTGMMYQPLRFVRMIRRQEDVLGIPFEEEGFVPLAPKAHPLNQHYQASRGWFMSAGSWAFHRKYIVKITQKSYATRAGRMYWAHVETIEGKVWKLTLESASDLKKFCQWYKNAA